MFYKYAFTFKLTLITVINLNYASYRNLNFIILIVTYIFNTLSSQTIRILYFD